MFDLRYHVASLAAVFFALVIGILVGVALASHGLKNTERVRLQEDLRRSENRADALRSQLDAVAQSGAADTAFVDRTYKLVMANRLKGKRIAVLFVGSTNGDELRWIRTALKDADGGDPLRIRAIVVPINETRLAKRLAKRPFLAAYAGDDQLQSLGHALGQEFGAGTDTPLWNALESLIAEESVGKAKPPADGVIVVRNAKPQMGPTALFLRGLYSGLQDAGIPAVGVDLSAGDGTAIKAFQHAGLSTVDDIETTVGKLALVLMLSDAGVRGDFGTKPTAKNGLLPKVVSPAPTTTSG